MGNFDVIQEFRKDHQEVLLRVMKMDRALQDGQLGEAQTLLGELDQLTGPHFQFEEEEFYPALERFFGKQRIGELVHEHDSVIELAAECIQLLKNPQVSKEATSEAANSLAPFYVHIANCDGLCILAEQLDSGEKKRLGESMQKYRREGKPLTQWAPTR